MVVAGTVAVGRLQPPPLGSTAFTTATREAEANGGRRTEVQEHRPCTPLKSARMPDSGNAAPRGDHEPVGDCWPGLSGSFQRWLTSIRAPSRAIASAAGCGAASASSRYASCQSRIKSGRQRSSATTWGVIINTAPERMSSVTVAQLTWPSHLVPLSSHPTPLGTRK